MALPIIPILVVGSIGLGALLLGRAKKITGGGGVGPVTPSGYGGYRVLSRAEAAAIGGSKMTYALPTGDSVSAADPAVDTMVTSMVAIGSQVSLVLKSSATGEIVLAIAMVDAVVPGPAYQGHLVAAKLFNLKTKAMTDIAGPLSGGTKVHFSPKDVVDVVPPKDLTMNAGLPGQFGST